MQCAKMHPEPSSLLKRSSDSTQQFHINFTAENTANKSLIRSENQHFSVYHAICHDKTSKLRFIARISQAQLLCKKKKKKKKPTTEG
jgi:hypothetical protein